MLSAELDTLLGRRPDLHVVTAVDGAHDNWRYLDALAPDATSVADFYHGAEQLTSALGHGTQRSMGQRRMWPRHACVRCGVAATVVGGDGQEPIP